MIFNLLGTPADGDVDMLEREDAKKYMRCFAAGATTNGVEHEEALEAGAVVRQLANAVEDQVDDLLADSDTVPDTTAVDTDTDTAVDTDTVPDTTAVDTETDTAVDTDTVMAVNLNIKLHSVATRGPLR